MKEENTFKAFIKNHKEMGRYDDYYISSIGKISDMVDIYKVLSICLDKKDLAIDKKNTKEILEKMYELIELIGLKEFIKPIQK